MEEIQNWEYMMRNPRQLLGEIHADLFPDHGERCPNCGQYNAKVSRIVNLKDLHCNAVLFECLSIKSFYWKYSVV